MLFTVLGLQESQPTSAVTKVFLAEDRWDDWAKYRTQFYLTIFDEDGKKYDVGSVKIGHIGLLSGREVAENTRAPRMEKDFESLPVNYFSLGQSENYYETLNLLSQDLKLKILNGLNDVAFNINLFRQVQGEEVMQESLLRFVQASNVTSRLHGIAIGNAALTPFQFNYTYPPNESSISLNNVLNFKVVPFSSPPTNVHVIIGRNGVGKTKLMQNFIKAMLKVPDQAGSVGNLTFLSEEIEDGEFSSLVSVSFSAFDDFNIPSSPNQTIRVSSIGLRYDDTSTDNLTKNPTKLSQDFVKSFSRCRTGPRQQRWNSAVETLCNDPLFFETNVSELIHLTDPNWENIVQNFYEHLSSGHKIVLLTITRLVELVDERTLVLLDEPEGHLHPPLLSAFIRSLSNLLIQRNGVAIIATHSPVVLQEVPKSCAWVLNREGAITNVIRPPNETFGENVGVLTRDVFGLEVISSGFHQIIKDYVEKGLAYNQLLAEFDGQLGAEGKAIAKALIAERNDI